MWFFCLIMIIIIGFWKGDNSLLIALIKIIGVLAIIIGGLYILVFVPVIIFLLIVVLAIIFLINQIVNKMNQNDVNIPERDMGNNSSQSNVLSQNDSKNIENFSQDNIFQYNESTEKIGFEFINELDSIIKTPTEAAQKTSNENQQKASELAKSDYSYIKKMIKEKAENGEYDFVNGKKRIILYNKGNLSNLLKSYSEIKTINKVFSTDTQFETIIKANDYQLFNYYEKELIKLGSKDGVKINITGVYYKPGTHKIIQEFHVPGRLVGTSDVFTDTFIKCEILLHPPVDNINIQSETIPKNEINTIINYAKKDYEDIKKLISDKINTSNYSTVEGEKHIVVKKQSEFLNMCINREYYENPIGNKIVYKIHNIEQYEFYIKTLSALLKRDTISIKPFYIITGTLSKKMAINLPYVYIDSLKNDDNIVKAYLKCTFNF